MTTAPESDQHLVGGAPSVVEHDRPTGRNDPALVRSFSAHLAQYIGIGLISGSVVHATTLGGSSLKYGILIAAGMVIYCMKFLIEANFRLDRPLLRFLRISTLVSLGTGMLSGAVQHYLDGPKSGAVLASTGLVLAYVAFCLREDRSALTRRSITGAVLIGAAVFGVLWLVADLVGEGGHSH